MSALRVMTFNVQLLPSVVTSSGGESEGRAERVVQALRALPASEQPDVIAFNEVFNEDGREKLYKGLAPVWPHAAYKLDDCMLAQDSGLMLVSRLPFATLNVVAPPFPGVIKGGTVAFQAYDASAASDMLACKGVGVVQVMTPIGRVTLAFTHLQASYDGIEDQHRDIRAKQLDTIEGVLARLLGPEPNNWVWVIVMGDLNIRGDPSALSNEWAATFGPGSSLWQGPFADGWRTFMRPPGSSMELDPGFTNNDLESGLLTRLDYQLFKRHTERALVPQHMFSRFRNLSDHWSLEALVHLQSPHCTPSTAIELASITPLSSGLRAVQVEIRFEGSYQWIFAKEPGTYSIFVRREVEAIVYAVDNLSDPWRAFDDSDMRLMDDVVRREGAEFRLGPKGKQYAVEGPFFILIRSNPRGLTGPYTGFSHVGVLRHTGASPGEAIFLHPWAEPLDPQLPVGKQLGKTDTCWFRLRIGSALSGAAHTSRFLLDNRTGASAHFALVDGSEQELTAQRLNGPAELTFTVPGPEDLMYLTLLRQNHSQVDFRVSWKSGLTYLRDDKNIRPLCLRAIDETGWDLAGADEIRMKLFADDASFPFFETFWDDADTGEALPLSGQIAEIAFVSSVAVEVDEEGDITADSPGVGIVNALTDADPRLVSREIAFGVQSGTYRFECTLGRTPRNI
jgi:endonuclease/exonuclease/phosphatase family metal-dependent hydrolase